MDNLLSFAYLFDRKTLVGIMTTPNGENVQYYLEFLCIDVGAIIE